MFDGWLYYVAPRESLDFIMKEGILPPAEVSRLIEKKTVSKEVLGVSYGGNDASHFPDHVSLLSNIDFTNKVADQIAFARTGRYHDDFMAFGYRIDPLIKRKPGFVDTADVQAMNENCYPSEVLFKGKIDRKYIHDKHFAVRTR